MEGCCNTSGSSATSPGTGRALDVAVLTLLAALLLYSLATGMVRLYLVSYYAWLPLPAALLLVAMAVARVYSGPCAACCGGDARSVLRRFGCAAVILAAMVTLLIVQPARYSSAGLRKRMMPAPSRDVRLARAVDWVLGIKATEAASGGAAGYRLPAQPTVADLVDAANNGFGDEVAGRFVSVVGQCDLAEGTVRGDFGLYRLVVTCCIADALAVSLEVRNEPKTPIAAGDWLKVGGIVRFDHPIDPLMPVLHASVISTVPQPNEPYL